ncbi:MAG: response regulator [Bacteroidetes bacterium]|nr:response regulator [Bacteroidota bacterium]NCQ12209.1 response regulator [Bacteroidota bacterium]
MKTIIADDDKTLLLLHSTFIKRSGICPNPLNCTDGSFAIEAIKSTIISEAILLFLDLNMPEVNGWEVLDFIAGESFPNPIFVIIVTSSVRQEDRNKAKNYEAVIEFVTKPIQASFLAEIKTRDFFIHNQI